MKVILDTNVFVSAVFFGGPPLEILRAWRRGEFDLVVSLEILDEYREVGQRLSARHPTVDLAPILDSIVCDVEIYVTTPLPDAATADPDDERCFAAAVASKAKYIVSGDKHLLRASGYAGITVLKPRAFLDILQK